MLTYRSVYRFSMTERREINAESEDRRNGIALRATLPS